MNQNGFKRIFEIKCYLSIMQTKMFFGAFCEPKCFANHFATQNVVQSILQIEMFFKAFCEPKCSSKQFANQNVCREVFCKSKFLSRSILQIKIYLKAKQNLFFINAFFCLVTFIKIVFKTHEYAAYEIQRYIFLGILETVQWFSKKKEN